MSKWPAIVDTNVVVAGLVTADPASPVSRVLEGMLGAAFPYVISDALLAEYRTVLVRPGLRKAHGLTVVEVDLLLIEIARHAIVLTPIDGPVAPDPGDQFLWDLLAVRHDLLLVTGDLALLADSAMQGRILTARAFLG